VFGKRSPQNPTAPVYEDSDLIRDHELFFGAAFILKASNTALLPMRKNVPLLVIRILLALNFLPAIFFKFVGAPLSVALFTTMSNSVHGVVSQPVFRFGSGAIESVLVLLFLIPRTARLGAALIAIWMVGPILSHVFVLGYGWFFVSALATFFLSCLYLFLARARAQSSPD
jgi:hypothetical protein